MKIKICGIRTVEEAEILNKAVPDFTGFVFAKSKRQVDFHTAKKIKENLNPKIKTAGVFVDNKKEEIIELFQSKIIDMAQLHGEYDENFIKMLQSKKIPVIKVVKVCKNEYNVETAADFVLFDYFSNVKAGGCGLSFDWNTKIKANVPFFVAGGLNENNLVEMAQKLKPYGADVSSGAELNGIKTKEKVFNIIKIAKGINV